jgi:beta-glucosidase
VNVAKQADAAIVFVNQAAGEGMDRDLFTLPGDQKRLVEAISEVNPNTIVVLNTPGTVLMPWIDQVGAVLQVWYPGEAIGAAITSILFRDTDPGGPLPITFPVTEKQAIPEYAGYGKVEFAEDIFVGYRYYQKQRHMPLFPFGYGLSYTEFEYSNLHIKLLNDDLNVAHVQVTVQNIGQRFGKNVVQVYIGELPVPVPTPIKQLAGFVKVALHPAELTTVAISIPRRLFSCWDESAKIWRFAKGKITVFVGDSSAMEQLTGILTVQ